jgi:hypothetical protein
VRPTLGVHERIGDDPRAQLQADRRSGGRSDSPDGRTPGRCRVDARFDRQGARFRPAGWRSESNGEHYFQLTWKDRARAHAFDIGADARNQTARARAERALPAHALTEKGSPDPIDVGDRIAATGITTRRWVGVIKMSPRAIARRESRRRMESARPAARSRD